MNCKKNHKGLRMAHKRIFKKVAEKLIYSIYKGKAPNRLLFLLPLSLTLFFLSILNRRRKKIQNDRLILEYIEKECAIDFDIIRVDADVFFLKPGMYRDSCELYEIMDSWQYSSKLSPIAYNRQANLLFKKNYLDYLNFYINIENRIFVEKIMEIISSFFNKQQRIHFFLHTGNVKSTGQFTTYIEKVSNSLEEAAAISFKCDFYCGNFDLVGKALLCNEIAALYNSPVPDHANNQQFLEKVFEENLENLNEEELKNILYPLLRGINTLK